MDRILPRLQLGLAVLFALISVLGPLLVPQGHLVILSAAATGILLGLVTFAIGWRMEIARSPVNYPFGGWSVRVLRLFLSPRQARDLSLLNLETSPSTRRLVGVINLAAGLLLIVGLLIVSVLVLSV